MVKRIGQIGNCYGDLQVEKERGKFYCGIENYDGIEWEEISEYLYQALISEEERMKESDNG